MSEIWPKTAKKFGGVAPKSRQPLTPRMGYTRIETERAGDARRARDAMVEHWRERGESTGEGLNRLCPEPPH